MSRDLHIYTVTPFILFCMKNKTSPVVKKWLIWSNVSKITELDKKVTEVTQNDIAVASELKREW